MKIFKAICILSLFSIQFLGCTSLENGTDQFNGIPAATLARPNSLSANDAMTVEKLGIAASFKKIKAGEFEMGEAHGSNDAVLRRVRITKDFEMQTTSVTQLQFFLVMQYNPSAIRNKEECDSNNFLTISGFKFCANHPVESITFNETQNFISKLNEIQNKYTYRLPTEAEREYATRAGTPTGYPYSFGSNDTNKLGQYGWFKDNSEIRTHAVALKKPNPNGLYDMHGNVSEWTQDYYRPYGQASDSIDIDPKGPTYDDVQNSYYGVRRVIRGGCFYDDADLLKSAERQIRTDEDSNSGIGFRLVRDIRI